MVELHLGKSPRREMPSKWLVDSLNQKQHYGAVFCLDCLRAVVHALGTELSHFLESDMQPNMPMVEAWQVAEQNLQFAEKKWHSVWCSTRPLGSAEFDFRSQELQASRNIAHSSFQAAMKEVADIVRSLHHIEVISPCKNLRGPNPR